MKGFYGWKESKMEENLLSIGSTNREKRKKRIKKGSMKKI